jgi:hypothetical protein
MSAMIISASRRSDIPAFHFPWFLERMRAGFVGVANPFNPHQIRRVSLAPGDIDCVVFWTKDARPMRKHLAEFEAFGVPYIILYTLTPYGQDIEPGLAGKSGIPDSFQEIAGHIGGRRLVWRYDPIILTGEMTDAWHCRAFAALAARLEGSVRRCIVSFAQGYRRVQKNLAALGWTAPEAAAKQELLAALSEIAAARGISLQSCADSDTPGYAGACIDAALIARVTGRPLSAGRDKNQRPACLCSAAVDIGRYGTCGHRCVYCYAGGVSKTLL